MNEQSKSTLYSIFIRIQISRNLVKNSFRRIRYEVFLNPIYCIVSYRTCNDNYNIVTKKKMYIIKKKKSSSP